MSAAPDPAGVLSDRLTGLDALFLHLERPETPMHVGSLQLCELPSGFDGDFAQHVRRHIGARLHLAPPLTRRLAVMPFDLANPLWIDGGQIDMAYHVRRHKLRAPGSMRQLERLVAGLHATLMDRDRPLWQFHVIEGLAEPGTVAVYSKLHHAAIDGQAGVALATVLLDPTPEPRILEESPFERRRSGDTAGGIPGGGPWRKRDLLAAALSGEGERYRELAHALRPAAEALRVAGAEAARHFAARVAAKIAGEEPPAGSTPRNWKLGPRTPFNVAVSDGRSFATTRLSLPDVRRVAAALDATVNDVVLAVCSAALRAYLVHHDQLPDESLIAAMPVSLRARGATDGGNQVMLSMVYLGSEIESPLDRLRAVRAATGAVKDDLSRFRTMIPTDAPSLGLPWLVGGAWAMYAHLWSRGRLPPTANVVISNVPGPPQPLYLAGARYRSFFPLSIVVHGVALNITLESYCDSLDFGLTACSRAVPDVERIAHLIPAGFAELVACVPAAAQSSRTGTKAGTRAGTKAGTQAGTKAATKAGTRAGTRTGTRETTRAKTPADTKARTAATKVTKTTRPSKEPGLTSASTRPRGSKTGRRTAAATARKTGR